MIRRRRPPPLLLHAAAARRRRRHTTLHVAALRHFRKIITARSCRQFLPRSCLRLLSDVAITSMTPDVDSLVYNNPPKQRLGELLLQLMPHIVVAESARRRRTLPHLVRIFLLTYILLSVFLLFLFFVFWSLLFSAILSGNFSRMMMIDRCNQVKCFLYYVSLSDSRYSLS